MQIDESNKQVGRRFALKCNIGANVLDSRVYAPPLDNGLLLKQVKSHDCSNYAEL